MANDQPTKPRHGSIDTLEVELARLREENARLRSERELVVAQANDGFWDWRIDDDYEYMSPRFWEMFGYRSEDKRHHPSEWQQLVHPDDLPAVLERFARHVESRGAAPFDQIVRYRHAAGHWVHVRCRGSVIEWNSDGSPRRMMGTHTDITQWVEERTRAEILYAASSVGLWDWLDVAGTKEYWSPRFFELLGYEFDEVPASLETFRDLLHPDDRERTFELVERHFAGDAAFDVEYRLRHKSGEYRWFHGLGEAVRDDEGNPVRMVGSIQDIHDRKVAEVELNRTNAELEQFVYFASHDLQAPLRHLVSFVGLLEEELGPTLDDEQRQWMGFIKKGANHMRSLIRDLLAYSRAGKGELSRDQVDLNELANQVFDIINAGHPDSGLELRAEPLPTIRANGTLIGQVLQNLLQNAVRYATPGIAPRVVVSVEDAGDRWVLHVADNGVGIAANDQQRIFEPFHKLGHRSADSTGIGLAICAKVAQRHGGDISVSSAPGEGATFHVSLAKAAG